MRSWYDRLLHDRWDRQWLQLAVLASLAGLVWLASWAAFLAFGWLVIQFFGWWIGKSYESPEGYFLYAVAPFLLWSVLAFAWTVIDWVIWPAVRNVWRNFQRSRR